MGHEGLEDAMEGLKQRIPDLRGHKISHSDGDNIQEGDD